MSLPTILTVLGQLQGSWQPENRLKITPELSGLSWCDGHPLASQLANLCSNKPCSLPFFSANKIMWVTFGGSQEELLETIEDLRCWVLPYLGKEEQNAVVTTLNAKRPQEKVLCSEVGWYFRWYCPNHNFKKVVKRFDSLSSLLDSRPFRELRIPPSLNSLRLEFLACLRTGEWEAAKKVVDLIDQWQLDTARNTQLMRIRLLYEEGDLESLISILRFFDILDGALPFRLLGVVVDAIYRVEIFPIEETLGWKDAFEHYQGHWQAKLSSAVIAHRSIHMNFHLSAYQAFSDHDRVTLQTLSILFKMELADSMLQEFPVEDLPLVNEPEVNPEEGGMPPSIAYSFWGEIESSVKCGSYTRARICIAELTDAVLGDPEWISVGAETLLEIFTDPLILGDSRSFVVAEEVLVAIIDTVINSGYFPRHEHAVIYDSLISTWVAIRGDSSSEQDGQLLLGLVGASIECSSSTINDCESAVRNWWGKRKILRRLPWLLGAIEMLVQDHPNTSNLQDLWIDGVDLISRLGVNLSKTERILWRRLGGFVGLDNKTISEMVVDPREEDEDIAKDPLSTLGLRKIALITLQERGARQAIDELKSRSGAEVIIVTSKSADSFTRAAESADLILFVWASSTHAVYRSFDHVREKIQYVQGTGPSSIVLAAERWAVQRKII